MATTESKAGGSRDSTPWKRTRGLGTPFFAGGFSGVISTVAFQPLDVVKTHIQAVNSTRPPKLREVVRFILQRDGLTGLWRGTGPACLRVGLGAGFYFAILGPVLSAVSTGTFVGSSSSSSSTKNLRDKLPIYVTLSAGAITRSVAAFLVCPITVVKTRMEYEAVLGLHYSSTVKAITVIARNEGLKGLYSGLVPTIVRDAPYSGLYLLMYTRIRNNISDSQVLGGSSQLFLNFIAGAIAGGGATVLTHPPDVIRTKLQLEDKNHTGIFSAVRRVFQMHGIGGFFAGVLPRAGRRALHQAFSWTIFEEIIRRSQL